MRRDYPEFVNRDAEVIVIGPEGKAAFQNYWDDKVLPFIGLPDPNHKVLKCYGQEVKLFKFGRMPAQVIVDKQGTVRFAHYGNSMQDIPDNKDLLKLLDEINN